MSQAENVVALMDDAAERESAVTRTAVVSETAAILSVIERAAQNPNVDIDKMERLFLMRERALDRTAREVYDSAFAEMQVKLPTIDQNGRITITDKNDSSKVKQDTSFAKFEDINDAVKPILAIHGFGLSFRTGVTPEGRITVTGILSHRGGHREETTMILPHDSTGSKNAVQAIGSSTSYGRRYTTLALLNITSRARQDRDDDGQTAVGSETISEDRAVELRELIEWSGADVPKLKKHFGVESINDLLASRFAEAERLLKAKGPRK